MKNIYMILRFSILTLLTLLMFKTVAFAQEEATEDTIQVTPKERPVRAAFEGGLLFDAATTTLNPAKTLEMIIQHRFGLTDDDNNSWDFFGIWGASNIRLGLNYSILNNLTVGIGTTKFNKMDDLQLKYRIIEQTRSNSIPLTVMFYEVVGIDGSADSKWQDNYKFNNRISYFSQLIISRRFNDHLSLQVAPGFTHYNSVDSLYDHDRISISFAGRYKFSPQGSLIFSGDFPLDIKEIYDYKKVDPLATVYKKPNLSLGFEISTSTHTFQIYLATAQGILPQEDIMWNKNYLSAKMEDGALKPSSVWNKDNIFSGNFLIGLNITRLWNF